MGEAQFAQSQTSQACQKTIQQCEQVVDEAMRVQTPGGALEVQWSSSGKATAMGQWAFFAEFYRPAACLSTGCKAAPCATPVPTHPRYEMSWAPGCWERAAQESQALKAEQWMQAQLRHSIAQATQTGWILDCDTTVKVLYGHQSGAVVVYNPQKPGRPSHIIHTYSIGNLRLVLDAQLQLAIDTDPPMDERALKP